MTGAPVESAANKDPESRFPTTGKYQMQMPVEAEVQVDPPAKARATCEAPADSAAVIEAYDPSSRIPSSANVAIFMSISFSFTLELVHIRTRKSVFGPDRYEVSITGVSPVSLDGNLMFS